MDQKEKRNDFSIITTFRKWLQIQGLEDAVFIFGNTASGKSTICQSLKKFIDNVDDEKFKIIEKKKDSNQYEYEDEINPKSTRPLTIYPKVYRIQQARMNLIEVPSRVYQLQKKRHFLDKIMNIVGLAHATKKARFVFVVETKHTSGKYEPWKKLFQNIFDSFKIQFLNASTFKSVGFIVTKSPTDINTNIYLNRMKDLYKLFNEQKRKSQYTELLKIIQSKQNLSIFNKVSNWQQTQKDIKQIYKFIGQLEQCQLFSQNQNFIQIQPIDLVKDELNYFISFNQTLRAILRLFRSIFNMIFSSKDKKNIKQNLKQKLRQQIRDISIKILAQDQKCQTSNIVIARYQKLLATSRKNEQFFQSIVGKCSFLLQYKQKIEKNDKLNRSVLMTFLTVLSEHGLIFQQSAQFLLIYRRLIEYSIFEQRFGSIILNINIKKVLQQQKVTYEFRQTHENALKQWFMAEKFSPDQTYGNATRILQILEQFYLDQDIKGTQKQEKKSYIKNIMLLKKFDGKNPSTQLPEIYKLLDQFVNVKKIVDTPQNRVFSKKLALLIAQVLKNYNRPDLCTQIFIKCGSYHSARMCYQGMISKMTNAKSEEIRPYLMKYLDILASMSLQQKAIQNCYMFAQKYNQLSPQILQKMKQIKQNRNQKFTQQFQQLFLNKKCELIDFYIDSYLLAQIEKIVQQMHSQQ